MFRLFIICLFLIAPQFSHAQVNGAEYFKLLKLQSDDHFIGDKKAPIQIIEYYSMSCPHCAEFQKKVFPALKQNYIDKGKVIYIARDFPTNRQGLLGAMLANCSPDKYFVFSKTLLESQAMWAYTNEYKESLINIGKLAGLTDTQIRTCLDSKENEKALLDKAYAHAKVLDIPATPMFFINGDRHEGEITVEALSKKLDAILNKQP